MFKECAEASKSSLHRFVGLERVWSQLRRLKLACLDGKFSHIDNDQKSAGDSGQISAVQQTDYREKVCFQNDL